MCHEKLRRYAHASSAFINFSPGTTDGGGLTWKSMSHSPSNASTNAASSFLQTATYFSLEPLRLVDGRCAVQCSTTTTRRCVSFGETRGGSPAAMNCAMDDAAVDSLTDQ